VASNIRVRAVFGRGVASRRIAEPSDHVNGCIRAHPYSGPSGVKAPPFSGSAARQSTNATDIVSRPVGLLNVVRPPSKSLKTQLRNVTDP